jgi:hypothetical protein
MEPQEWPATTDELRAALSEARAEIHRLTREHETLKHTIANIVLRKKREAVSDILDRVSEAIEAQRQVKVVGIEHVSKFNAGINHALEAVSALRPKATL